jgi:hypothetical protein
MPDNAFFDPSTFVFSLAAACRLGVYDFTGMANTHTHL